MFVIITLLLCTSLANGRQLEARLNPGCAQCGARAVALRAAARGARDSLQALWALGAAPALLAARAPPAATLALRWWRAAPAHFAFSERPYYGYGLVVDSLYEYDDVKGTGVFDPSSPHTMTLLSDLQWQLINSSLSDKEAFVDVRGTFDPATGRNGHIGIQLSLPATSGVDSERADTSIRLQLVNLTTSPNYEAPRFALRFILISTDDAQKSWTFRAINDSRGQQLVYLQTPGNDESSSAFLEMQTIAYTNKEHTKTTAAIVSPTLNRAELPNSGWVKQYYQDYPLDGALLLQEALLSLGACDYCSWTSTFGNGFPASSASNSRSPLSVIILVVCTLIAVGGS